MDDAALLHAFVHEKSESAFRTLVDRHVRMVYGVCMRKLRDPHWAEDVSQAVFILLAKKAATLKPGVVLGGWLYRTAVFACSNARDLQRTRDFHENRVVPMNDAELNREQPDPLEAAEVEGLLDEALMTLTDEQREVLVLRFFENKSLADVAKARGATLYATEKALESGLARLRRFLSQRGVTVSLALLSAIMLEQSVKAVPAALAGAITTAAIGGTAAVSAHVAALVSHLLKVTFPSKLLAALTGAAALLLAGTILLAFGTPLLSAGKSEPPVAVNVSGDVASRPPTLEEQAALWSTLKRTEAALRAMDNDALNREVLFTQLRDARDWDAMSRVFAADFALKRAAVSHFGQATLTPEAAGGGLTAIRTFAEQLDAILPAIDPASASCEVMGGHAVVRFSYFPDRVTSAAGTGGAVYFARDDAGVWRIDAGATLDIVLEGLDRDGTRQSVDRLDGAGQSLVWSRMEGLERALTTVRSRLLQGEFTRPEDVRTALQSAADLQGLQGRAFFHLALKRDRQEEARL